MTQHQPAEFSTSWGIRRGGLAVLAAVSFATVVPALANAAGADVPNPVFLALRSAGEALAGEESCEAPVPQATPSASPGVAPSGEPAGCEEEDEVDVVDPTRSPEPSGSSGPAEQDEQDEGEATAGEHGRIVSTVAQCAPRGKDPLFATLDDDLRNHGSFVRAAAHGDTLSTPWGEFDLSTQTGADALCAAVGAARAELAAASPAHEDEKGQKDKGRGKGKGKPHQDERAGED